MGGVARRHNVNVYHVLPELMTRTNVACWHCCESITQCIPIPRLYDSSERVYHVFGATCSPACAKAYIIEHSTFDRGQNLSILSSMMADVYGITGHISETPPRPALRRFGGIFDPAKPMRAECRLIAPPFVSYCMIAEERAVETFADSSMEAGGRVEDVDALKEPPPPALFQDFLQRRREQGAGKTEAPPKREREDPPPRASTSTVGPITRFVRPKREDGD